MNVWPFDEENQAELDDDARSNSHLDRNPEAASDPSVDLLDELSAEEQSLADSNEEEEEFSLSQLSQAYAKVLRGEGLEVMPAEAVETAVADLSQSSNEDDSQGSLNPQVPLQDAVDRDTRDNASCPITPESIVEAIVFVGLPGDEKLTLKKIASLLRDVSPKDIKSIVKQLNLRYEREQSAFRISLADGAVSMELDESMHPFRQACKRSDRGVKLNAATIEVLAIVAYNQPITREKIDHTRKRPSAAILAQLVRRGLIAVEETTPKRKLQFQQYVTTEKFLDLFQLSELADLPHGQDMADLDELIQ